MVAEALNDDGVAGLSLADLTAAQVIPTGPTPAVFDISGSISATTDDDLYAISVSAGDRLQASLLDARLGGGAAGSVRIDLYDASLNRLTEGRRQIFNDVGAAAGDAFLDHTFDAAGTYYLHVFNPDTAGSVHVVRCILDD